MKQLAKKAFRFAAYQILLWLRKIRQVYWRIVLGDMQSGAHIYSKVAIHNPRMVKIGRNVVLNDFVHIWGGGGVEIGDNSVIAAGTVITSQTHDPRALTDGKTYGKTSIWLPVYIGQNVWIGSNAVIMPGIRIGDNAIIGAGAIVTKDVPERSVAVGVPARVTRDLS